MNSNIDDIIYNLDKYNQIIDTIYNVITSISYVNKDLYDQIVSISKNTIVEYDITMMKQEFQDCNNDLIGMGIILNILKYKYDDLYYLVIKIKSSGLYDMISYEELANLSKCTFINDKVVELKHDMLNINIEPLEVILDIEYNIFDCKRAEIVINRIKSSNNNSYISMFNKKYTYMIANSQLDTSDRIDIAKLMLIHFHNIY